MKSDQRDKYALVSNIFEFLILYCRMIYEQARNSAFGQILTEVLGDELITIVHDEDPAHVQLDVVLLFLVLKEIKGGAARYKKQGTEFQLTLYRKVL